MLDRYGLVASSQFVDAPSIGGRAHALVAGDGPGVVLLGGLGTPAAMWAPLAARLDGVRLHLVDLPGHGLTAPAPRLADGLRDNAPRFLTEVLDGLGLDRPVVVGNSMGSLWASWLALDRPRRVAALVHVGCPALALGTSAPLSMRLLSSRPLGRLLTWLEPPSPRQVEQLSRVVKQHPLVPELVDLLVATERMPGFRDQLLSTLHRLVRLRGSRPALRLTAAELARIEQPALLVWGEDDPFGSPGVGAGMAAAMPAATLHVVRGGHAPWLTEAEAIGHLIAPFIHRHG